MTDYLDEARRAARAAGEIIARGIRHVDTLPAGYTGIGDVLGSIESAASTVIREVIRASFPEHRMLDDASAAPVQAAGESDYCWIVNPLDGTQNVVHGIPHCAVSVALTRGKDTLVAVVFDPLRDEMFVATGEAATTRNGESVHTSGCKRIDEAVLGTVFPMRGTADLARYTPGLLRALAEAGGVRRSGSMLLDLAWVACGRLDGFWQLGMAPRAATAGTLLVTQAGGHVAAFDGRADLVDANALFACVPVLAEALRTLCAPTERA